MKWAIAYFAVFLCTLIVPVFSELDLLTSALHNKSSKICAISSVPTLGNAKVLPTYPPTLTSQRFDIKLVRRRDTANLRRIEDTGKRILLETRRHIREENGRILIQNQISETTRIDHNRRTTETTRSGRETSLHKQELRREINQKKMSLHRNTLDNRFVESRLSEFGQSRRGGDRLASISLLQYSLISKPNRVVTGLRQSKYLRSVSDNNEQIRSERAVLNVRPVSERRHSSQIDFDVRNPRIQLKSEANSCCISSLEKKSPNKRIPTSFNSADTAGTRSTGSSKRRLQRARTESIHKDQTDVRMDQRFEMMVLMNHKLNQKDTTDRVRRTVATESRMLRHEIRSTSNERSSERRSSKRVEANDTPTRNPREPAPSRTQSEVILGTRANRRLTDSDRISRKNLRRTYKRQYIQFAQERTLKRFSYKQAPNTELTSRIILLLIRGVSPNRRTTISRQDETTNLQLERPRVSMESSSTREPLASQLRKKMNHFGFDAERYMSTSKEVIRSVKFREETTERRVQERGIKEIPNDSRLRREERFAPREGGRLVVELIIEQTQSTSIRADRKRRSLERSTRINRITQRTDNRVTSKRREQSLRREDRLRERLSNNQIASERRELSLIRREDRLRERLMSDNRIESERREQSLREDRLREGRSDRIASVRMELSLRRAARLREIITENRVVSERKESLRREDRLSERLNDNQIAPERGVQSLGRADRFREAITKNRIVSERQEKSLEREDRLRESKIDNRVTSERREQSFGRADRLRESRINFSDHHARIDRLFKITDMSRNTKNQLERRNSNDRRDIAEEQRVTSRRGISTTMTNLRREENLYRDTRESNTQIFKSNSSPSTNEKDSNLLQGTFYLLREIVLFACILAMPLAEGKGWLTSFNNIFQYNKGIQVYSKTEGCKPMERLSPIATLSSPIGTIL